MVTSSSKHRTRTPQLHYIFLAALFAGVLLYQVRSALDIPHAETVSVPEIVPATASASLDAVSPEAEKAGLHRGDVLQAINGRAYTGTSVLAEAIAHAQPEENVFVTVSSQGSVHTVALPVTRRQMSAFDMALEVAPRIAMAALCILLGFWVVLARPRDTLAWLLLVVLLAVSQILGGHTIESWGPGCR
jgi:hypothetical protein